MKSTKAMRDRIRELMPKAWDDYDRAVDCVLEDLETSLVRIEALEAELKLTKEHLNEGGRIILANVAHSEALEAALRGIIQTLESLNDTKRASFYRGGVVNELTMALDIARAAFVEGDK